MSEIAQRCDRVILVGDIFDLGEHLGDQRIELWRGIRHRHGAFLAEQTHLVKRCPHLLADVGIPHTRDH